MRRPLIDAESIHTDRMANVFESEVQALRRMLREKDREIERLHERINEIQRPAGRLEGSDGKVIAASM